MNTSAIARISQAVSSHSAAVDQLSSAIRSATQLDDLTEARARIEAIRAWAKVHGQASSLRAELLVVEMEALVRIVELGGIDTLAIKDREAAQWLADMTYEERQKLIQKSGSTTTVVGMCRSIWREREVKYERARCREAGVELATSPSPAVYDESVIVASRGRAHNLSGVLADIADDYIKSNVDFTVEELADQIIAESGVDEEVTDDEAFIEGLREVCRRAVRSSPPLSVDGLPIPRLITARVDGKYRRIPVANAAMSHLDSMIADREEQILHDQAALQKLIDVAAKLRKIPGGSDNSSRIGDLIARLALAT